MNMRFENKRISGILSVVPENRVKFIDEIDNYGFSREKSLKLQKLMGFNERRIVENSECTSDLCIYGLEYLFNKGTLNKEEISALVLITQSPDHFMPSTSAIIHGKLGLGQDVLCFDINNGCTGYIYGLLQAFSLLNIPDIKKVVLLTGDTLSRRTNPQDRNISPLIGDGAAITIIENSPDPNEIFMNLFMDGSRSDWLIIPAGGFRMPSTDETRQTKVLPDGNKRSDEDLYMNGAGIFIFTQTDVFEGVKSLFEFAPCSINDIDYFMVHQPNEFMINKLSSKLGISLNKVPSNIVGIFGNPSAASIPLDICYNIRDLILEKSLKLCLVGFGVGLSWGGIIMDVGPLDFCELIDK